MSDSSVGPEKPVETIFKAQQSASVISVEVPPSEWSSMLLETAPENAKKLLYEAGLYDPGSGDICDTYIAMSDSDVFNHPYFSYPSVLDPGIEHALFGPEPVKIYPQDGQELYMKLCEDMKIFPVKTFYKGLLESTIDLKFYGLDPVGVRAMCIALAENPHVKRLDLSSNHMSMDACYHIGDLFQSNCVLKDVLLSGCKLKVYGLRFVINNLLQRKFDVLDLSKNKIGDEGFQSLAEKLMRGAVIKKLNLSHNDLTATTLEEFAEVLQYESSITHLDLSWNQLGLPSTTTPPFFGRLARNAMLVECDLSWNSLRTNKVLAKLLDVKTLTILNLSNNYLPSLTIKAIARKLQDSAPNLQHLNLSYNPMTREDAVFVVQCLNSKGARKLKRLLMDDLLVDKAFIAAYNQMKQLKIRKDIVVTYGRIYHNYTPSVPDMRTIVLKRLDYLTKVKKHSDVDIAVYFSETRKERENLWTREMQRYMKLAGIAGIGEDMVVVLAKLFPGPTMTKGGLTIDLQLAVDYCRQIWPFRDLNPKKPAAT